MNIQTIAGALRAIGGAATPEELARIEAHVRQKAWNDGGAIRQALERRREAFLRDPTLWESEEADPPILGSDLKGIRFV